VWSRANFDDLRKIAAVSDVNAFVPVGTRNFDLGDIYRRVGVPKIEAQQKLESGRVPRPSRYHPFAVAALLLLVSKSLVREAPPAAMRAIATGTEAEGRK
jgi:hypothetical protein